MLLALGLDAEPPQREVGMDAVKAQIEALGGTIRVHSEPGRGTRFVLTARVGVVPAAPAVRAA